MVENNKNDKLLVFDTTLRDGEQSAGASLTAQDKFRIASQLQKLNVDIIEPGFAASSPGQFSAVRKILFASSRSVFFNCIIAFLIISFSESV